MFNRTIKYVKPSLNGIVPVTFKYSGGPYIDVSYGSHKPVSLSVINVWDYDGGKSRVETRDDFNKAVMEFWHNEQGEIRDCIAQLPKFL